LKPQPTRLDVLLVINYLGAAVLLGMGGLMVLIDRKADPVSLALLAGFIGTSLGVLGTLLTSTSSSSRQGTPGEPPQTVTITQPEGQPVPVQETPDLPGEPAVPLFQPGAEKPGG